MPLVHLVVGLALLAAAPESPTHSPASYPSAMAERPARQIDRLARDYRIAVYNTFRRQRGEFERRRAAASELVRGWKQNGRPADQAARLIDWLHDATAASTADSIGPLPPAPELQPTAGPSSGPRHAGGDSQRQPKLSVPVVTPGVPVLERETSDLKDSPQRDADATSRRKSLVLRDVAKLLLGQRPAVRDVDDAPGDDRRAAPATSAPNEPRVEINWDEVVARATGHNLLVAQLQDDVLRDGAAAGVSRLERMVTQLEQLATAVEDLQPYYGLAPESVRPQLPALVRPQLAATAIAKHLGDARRQSANTGGGSENRASHAERLDGLSRRLAEAVNRMNRSKP